jgi:hypothetical protein
MQTRLQGTVEEERSRHGTTAEDAMKGRGRIDKRIGIGLKLRYE